MKQAAIEVQATSEDQFVLKPPQKGLADDLLLDFLGLKKRNSKKRGKKKAK